MAKRHENFQSLKRIIYLWVVPCVLAALVLNNFLQNSQSSQYLLGSIINTVLIIWFSIGWILLFKNRMIRFVEITTLFIVSLYHVITFYDVIYNYILPGLLESLGDFIIWMPIYVIYMFITLKNKHGLMFAIFIFLLTLIPGILNFGSFSAETIDSLLQFYLANIVYIVIFHFAQYLFGVYAELAAAKRDAYIDSLTGIANRHQIDKWLEAFIGEAGASSKPLSVSFFDIDRFKVVNDRYGHPAGDAILREFVSLIEGNLKPEEKFGRWGGEEFIVIIQEPEEAAAALAEHLRRLIEKHDFAIAGKVTSSFGVAGYQEGDTIITLLDRADKALYDSKQAGRNQVKRA